MLGGSPTGGVCSNKQKKWRYSERSMQRAPSIVRMAPSVSYVMFLKILIAGCSLNSSWDQSYDYFCVSTLIWSGKSIKIHWRFLTILSGSEYGFWWIPTSNEESATKILVTLVSGGVGRATDYQDLQKYPVGHARSHPNDARGTLDAPLRISFFFSLAF